MVLGFVTDLIGIHSIFGAFVFGLTTPKGGNFAERLIERIEHFVSGLLLPLCFASSGLKTNGAKIRGGKAGASDSRYQEGECFVSWSCGGFRPTWLS
ncbi:hypothetical protein AHAS_Ahas01G0115900 [Arachis hypogaea]